MTRILLTASAIALGLTLVAPDAMAGPRDRIDRIEDRIDRRESYIDRQTDNGRLDRIEDRLDCAESIADRRGREFTPRLDRLERRSWWRLRGGGAS